MLSALPFPEYLGDVPDLAGGHYERMDSAGYPRRLNATEMSPAARSVAIADIFEALTAPADLPQQERQHLSEPLQIITAVACRGHLDPELFALFVRSGVADEYCRRFLAPAQLDVVEVEPLLAGIEAPLDAPP